MQPRRGLKSVALMKAANSARVTSNLASAKGLAIVTGCCGSSRPASPLGRPKRSSSPAAAPIWKLPAGTTTISGQFGQSRKVLPGVLAALAAGAAVGAGCGVAAGGAGCGAATGCGAGGGGSTAGGAAAGAGLGGAGAAATVGARLPGQNQDRKSVV